MYVYRCIYYLFGGFKHFLFSITYGIILPIDCHIFQRGRSTTNQLLHAWKRINSSDLERSCCFRKHSWPFLRFSGRFHALSCPQIWILNGWGNPVRNLSMWKLDGHGSEWRNRPSFFYMFWFLGFQARTSSSNFLKSRSSTQQINVDIHGESASLRRP